jgi:hypothetical protein
MKQAWIAIAAGLAATAAAPLEEVPWPQGYRTWTHVKSAYVGPGHPAAPKYEGLHSLYANELAMQGYRSGRFPVGAVIAYDQLAAKVAAAAIEPAERKFVDVMRKGPDGWVFGEYAADGKTRQVTAADGVKQCAACHAGPGTQDGVFSRFRD